MPEPRFTSGDAPFDEAELLALLPERIENYRKGRYFGEGLELRLGDFAVTDRAVLEECYRCLLDLQELMHSRASSDDRAYLANPEELKSFGSYVRGCDFGNIRARMQSLGEASVAESNARKNDEFLLRLRQACHDLRGGPFQSLGLYLQLLEEDAVDAAEIDLIRYLTRDQLKIMRNALTDIDPERRRADEGRKTHNVELMLEKWQNSLFYRAASGPVRLQIECSYRGAVSESCLEYSTLERALYNFLNNAARNAADRRIYLHIFNRAEDPSNLRFVVYNQIRENRLAELRDRFGGDDLAELFEGGFTTGGSGLGMNITADIISHAFGVHSAREAAVRGYVGARLVRDCFVNWLHWPAAGD